MDGDRFAARLYEMYGLKPLEIRPMQSGYRNHNYPARLPDNSWVNLIVYKREPDIAAAILAGDYVADYLHSRGYPARYRYDERLLRVRTARGERLAAMYAYLPGETIPWEAYTREHIKTLGGAMSDMHALLRKLPRGPLPLATERCRALLRRMEAYFVAEGVQAAVAAKLGLRLPRLHAWRLYEWAFQQLETAPAQPIHLDFVRGNILFLPGTAAVSGVLDFEKAACGSPLFDIARTLAFLLVDCKYKTPEQVRKYFLRSGYQKRGAAVLPVFMLNAAGQPVDALEVLIDFFLLHDFYKFLRHNPYEALAHNQHYVRTRDLLLSRRLLARQPE